MDNFRTYHEMLIEILKDPIEAQAYLEVAIDEFILDHDRAAFLHALRAVAEAQGGLLNLSKNLVLTDKIYIKHFPQEAILN